jgi:hypothetical protein
MFDRLFGKGKILRMYHLEMPEDDIYAFYEQLGLPQGVARQHQLELETAQARQHSPEFTIPEFGNTIINTAWAAFSDGELDILPDSRPHDRKSGAIFGSQPTQGSFYQALQAERRKVERTPAKLLPAFEYLQLLWGGMLAKRLAKNPAELDRLGPYARIQQSGIAFAPIMSNQNQGEPFTMSTVEQIHPLRLVIEIDPEIRGAFAVQRLYDGRLATPHMAQRFGYWTIHRNDFHAQYLSVYLDAYGEYLFDYWSKNKINLAPLYLSTNLPMYLEYCESLGGQKDFGRMLREGSGFACLKGDPADKINEIIDGHRGRGQNHEVVSLVLWTSTSVVHQSEQELANTLSSVHTILRPGGGVLVGAPLLQQSEEAEQALKRVETIANATFGKAKVRNYPVGNTDSKTSIPISYVFMRK